MVQKAKVQRGFIIIGIDPDPQSGEMVLKFWNRSGTWGERPSTYFDTEATAENIITTHGLESAEVAELVHVKGQKPQVCLTEDQQARYGGN